jgi:hypothetical protein
MKIENEMRVIRYGLGIVYLLAGLLGLYVIDLAPEKVSTLLGLFYVFMLFTSVAFLSWSAILIGRCETVIQYNCINVKLRQ